MILDLESLIKQAQSVDLLRFTTAGSVDDGKSTLIGRLLHDARGIYEDHLASLQEDSEKAGRDGIDFALLLDGLRAEREQGITIDVAYRHFATPRRRFIIADTPGHEQYTRNMVTGASTANLAVILIDAQKGVVTQSKRHGFIASLLGIPHLVIAVNKMDLVGFREEIFEQICAEFREFSAKLKCRDLSFIPISALYGDNVVHRSANMPWFHGVPLLTHLETVHIASDQNLIDLRFPVQYVLRPHGGFRGYSGTVASGIFRLGDEIIALPSGKTTRISRILLGERDLEYAFPPQSVTVCVEDDIDIGRGDMLAHPGNLPWIARDLEALLIWMDQEPLELGRRYIAKHTTQSMWCRFTELRYRIDPDTLHRQPAEKLHLNEIGRVSASLFRPIFCDEYERNRQTGCFIVIDPQSNFTVGAGLLIDRSHRYETLHLESPTADRPASVSVPHLEHHSGHVTSEDRARLLGQRPTTIWLTGLSGSGKSTIAYALEESLTAEGRACFVLDGDRVRQGLNKDLGFSHEDRAENIRRAAEVARLMNEAGLIVIAAFISPFSQDRAAARQIIGPDRFIEVFLNAPLEICEQRDPKGLYVKARAGEIPEFTGITSAYEVPENPDLILDTAQLEVREAVRIIRSLLKQRNFID